MGQIIGLDGKVLHSEQSMAEAVEVLCQVLVSDYEGFMGKENLTVGTPKGPVSLPVQNIVANMAQGILSFMKQAGQKEMIFRLVDDSTDLIKPRSLQIQVMPLIPVEDEVLNNKID